jgi:hypothetical protein
MGSRVTKMAKTINLEVTVMEMADLRLSHGLCARLLSHQINPVALDVK